ncbi:MAG: HAD family hydrolase [Sphingomonadales bacterium]|nr:HAD family hydrolase [Sphingomonadales bacterium]MBD3773758.1 HAD family hydrolase [Paracoccaceae bacterium]
MSRPLIISDCDEVLLHMVAHFRDWLGESEGVDFRMDSADFSQAMRWQASGEPVEVKDIWRLLGAFFDTEMHRQLPIEGAVEAIVALGDHADIVVLTNLNDDRRERRSQQLAGLGIEVPVFTNQGPKGPALERIIAQHRADHGTGPVIFIDDLPQHHHSAAETVPGTTRLHMCGEPMIAQHIDCAHRAGHAHARIDRWAEALPWLLDQLQTEGEEA